MADLGERILLEKELLGKRRPPSVRSIRARACKVNATGRSWK